MGKIWKFYTCKPHILAFQCSKRIPIWSCVAHFMHGNVNAVKSQSTYEFHSIHYKNTYMPSNGGDPRKSTHIIHSQFKTSLWITSTHIHSTITLAIYFYIWKLMHPNLKYKIKAYAVQVLISKQITSKHANLFSLSSNWKQFQFKNIVNPKSAFNS